MHFVILWMLCGWFALRFKTEKPELVFVVDTSASMATQDSAYKDQTQLSRIESVENSFRGTRRAIKAVSQGSRRNAQVTHGGTGDGTWSRIAGSLVARGRRQDTREFFRTRD